MTELKSVSFLYNRKSKTIIDDISYCFNSCLHILKGPNGSGKTTLGKLLCGLLKPVSGEIIINGNSTKFMHIGEISKYTGYMFQNPDMHFFAPSVYEELLFPYDITDSNDEKVKEKADFLLKQFNLDTKINNFPLLLSKGERQRLALATILMRDVSFIILDEPTSSMDYEGKKYLHNFLSDYIKKGNGALVITHDEEFLQMTDSCIVLAMEEGKIVEKKT